MKLGIGSVRPEKANDEPESLYRAKVRGVSMPLEQAVRMATPRRCVRLHRL